ncbi:MAG: putative nucleic acid-binding protein [Kiritimatiellia bacterium]|jgi:predicted nucleic acid-binding protein
MPAKHFLDTNILLYGYDLDAGEKRTVALALLSDGWENLGVNAISVQVLQEFFVNALRKGMPRDTLVPLLEDLSLWPVIDNSLELFGRGVGIQERFQLSLWDAMIVAAAKTSGARILLTEDLNHGQDYDGVIATNPFI